MKRFLWLFVIVCLFLICTGCGDTFRPIIIPNPPKFPDPRASHSVVAISDNNTDPSQVPPQSNRGTVMSVNVSGDTVVGVADVGLAPVHAVQQTASQVLVVNHSVDKAIGDSLTKVTFFGTQISGTPTTISLPPNSAPNFIASTESSTAYVTLPNYFDPDLELIVPSVGVVNTVSNVLVDTIQVANNPIALAETPDTKKLYVANEGSDSVAGSVSSINTIDRSLNPDITSDVSHPLWLTVRSDSQRLYVLSVTDSGSKAGTLATFDTSNDTEVPDSLLSVGLLNVGDAVDDLAPKSYMVYDGRLNRLYIPSRDVVTGAQLVVVDVSSSQPPAPVKVPIATVQPSARNTQDPCAVTAPTTLNAVSVAALPDSSRVYVGAYYVDAAGNICPQVTAINTSSNTIKTATAVPGFPGFSPFSPPVCATARFRFSMAAGGDSTRIYLASCDGGNVNVIDTATDTYLLNLPAPGSSRPPIDGNQPPPQNPVFLFAGP